MSETKPITVEAYEITEAPGLDRIQVMWRNLEPGQGYCTIICYGQVWTVYFGAMNGQTIQQFFSEAGADYLVNKLSATSEMRKDRVKRHEAYLERIIKAVQESLKTARSEAA